MKMTSIRPHTATSIVRLGGANTRQNYYKRCLLDIQAINSSKALDHLHQQKAKIAK